ncbi:MAG: hypothetical protein KC549_19110 [Myxococcales bacterium]|nr:hypothetical protein [Myxococcales bacterium]
MPGLIELLFLVVGVATLGFLVVVFWAVSIHASLRERGVDFLGTGRVVLTKKANEPDLALAIARLTVLRRSALALLALGLAASASIVMLDGEVNRPGSSRDRLAGLALGSRLAT